MKQDILKFDVHIKGIRPILSARYPTEGTPTGKPNKREQFERSLYLSNKATFKYSEEEPCDTDELVSHTAKLYQPASHLVGAMVNAGKRFKVKEYMRGISSGRLTFKEVITGGVFVIPEEIPYSDEVTKGLKIDWRVIKNPNTGGRIMCARGRIDEWELKFQLHCWDNRANAKALKDILMAAGAYIGIGAYRPRYGRFEVVEWKKLKE